MYSCEICNYSTGVKQALEKHFLSKKHVKAFSELNKKSTGNIFSCKFCGLTFKYRSGLSKHMNMQCSSFNDSQNKTNLSSKHSSYEDKQQIIDRQERILDMLLNIIQTNANAAESNAKASENTSKSMNILTRATRDFATAPPLQKMPTQTKLPGCLEYDPKTKRSIQRDFDADLFMEYDKQNKLHEYFGNIILNNYVTENPNDRQFWEADNERQHFIVKIGDTRENSVWIKDYSGKKIKEIVLTTFFADIQFMLIEYASQLAKYGLENVDKDNTLNMEKSMKQQLRFFEIGKIIQSDKFFCDILSYIAPDMRFNDSMLSNYRVHSQVNPNIIKSNKFIFNLISNALNDKDVSLFDNDFIKRNYCGYENTVSMIVKYQKIFVCVYYKNHENKIKESEIKDIVSASDKILSKKDALYSDIIIKVIPVIVYNKKLSEYEIEILTDANLNSSFHDETQIKELFFKIIKFKDENSEKLHKIKKTISSKKEYKLST